MTRDEALKFNHAGMAGLLCDVALHLREGAECDELRDLIEQAIADWCGLTGWTYRRILHRIELMPPASDTVALVAAGKVGEHCHTFCEQCGDCLDCTAGDECALGGGVH